MIPTRSARHAQVVPLPRDHPPAFAGHPPARRKSGFTLAESVVALAVLVSGALVLVVASAAAVRVVSEGDAQTAAVLAARNRVERLAGATCATVRDGMAFDSAVGVRESWRIVPGRRSATRFALDSVEYLDRSGDRRAVVIGRLILC